MNKLKLTVLLCYAVFGGISLGIIKIISPGGQSFTVISILGAILFLLPSLWIYSYYSTKFSDKIQSKGIVLAAIICVIMSIALIGYSIHIRQEIKQLDFQDAVEKIGEVSNIILVLFSTFMFALGILIPLIDLAFTKIKKSLKEKIILFSTSVGVHLVFIFWYWVAGFVVAMLVFFTSW